MTRPPKRDSLAFSSRPTAWDFASLSSGARLFLSSKPQTFNMVVQRRFEVWWDTQLQLCREFIAMPASERILIIG